MLRAFVVSVSLDSLEVFSPWHQFVKILRSRLVPPIPDNEKR